MNQDLPLSVRKAMWDALPSGMFFRDADVDNDGLEESSWVRGPILLVGLPDATMEVIEVRFQPAENGVILTGFHLPSQQFAFFEPAILTRIGMLHRAATKFYKRFEEYYTAPLAIENIETANVTLT